MKLTWVTKYADDVGFPSVGCEYVLLPLINKEAALTMAGQNKARQGKLN